MKAYEIRDYESEENVGVLLYYEQGKDFIIELKDALDEWTAPLLFSGFVKSEIYTISRDISQAYGEIGEYFEIFMERMLLCQKAAGFLNLEFHLIINEQTLM